MWNKSSKVGLGIYGSPRNFNPLSHTGKIYQLVERTNPTATDSEQRRKRRKNLKKK